MSRGVIRSVDTVMGDVNIEMRREKEEKRRGKVDR
jgi:hypothetical protein